MGEVRNSLTFQAWPTHMVSEAKHLIEVSEVGGGKPGLKDNIVSPRDGSFWGGYCQILEIFPTQDPDFFFFYGGRQFKYRHSFCR